VTVKLCESCWSKLRAAIKARGIDHLVKTAAGVHTEMITALEGKPTEAPDPLMAANNMIWSNAIRIYGLGMMAPMPDGSERCPVCTLVNECNCGRGDDCPYRRFIDRAADDALALVSMKDAP
jgi:hypothetical protein